MKKKFSHSISLIFIILFFICLQTIVYSSFSTTMNLTGMAQAKIEKNVKITDFRLFNATDSSSFYEEFSENTVSTSIRMIDPDTSSIMYAVEVTNYGASEVGILNITGLPEQLSYELLDYSLGDIICDDDETEKCSSGAVRIFLIEITGTPGDYEFTLEFDFKIYHKVTYTNVYLYSSYQTRVMENEKFSITFEENLKEVSVLLGGNELYHYDQISSGQTITIENVSNNIEIKSKEELSTKITNFKLSTDNNAQSFSEQFSDNTITTYIRMFDPDTSSIIFSVEVTNYGENEVGILDIVGLPEQLSYELINYSLEEIICDDDTETCTSGAVKTFLIEITGTPGDYEFTLYFNFKTYYKVTYTNIYLHSSYPTKVIEYDDFNITFEDDMKDVSVLLDGNELYNYEQITSGQTLAIENVLNNIEIRSKEELSTKITNFKLSSSNGIDSFYEYFSDNTVSTYLRILDGDDGFITFDVKATNYGESEVGILNITGLPEQLSYELIDYSLGDKICDDTGKCNSDSVKTFQIKITGNPGDYGITLYFDFETYHKVTYTNIYTYNSYPTEVIDGEDLSITFEENIEKVSVLSNGVELYYYDQITSGQTITIENVTNNIEIISKEELSVRITNFKLSSSNSGYSFYEKFTANTFTNRMRLIVDDSGADTYIKFDVEVTNYAESEAEIVNITGIPDKLSYEIIDYSLGDKICDDTGKCNSGAVKTFQIEFTGPPGDYEFTLEFEFKTTS